MIAVTKVAFRNALLVAATLAVLAWGLSGQTAAQRPAFEVASVKLRAESDPRSDFVPRRSGDHVTMHSVQLGTVIAWAYKFTNPNYQLVAGPWRKVLYEDDYDIQALAPGAVNDDTLRLMFQRLLEERFQLKVHRETRTLASYDLVVLKGGPKLTAAPARDVRPTMGYGGSSSWGEFRADGKHLVGKSASIEEMVVVLTTQMHAPVRDRTGITGLFDYDLAFSTGVDGSEKPVLTTAIRDLGLGLEKSNGTFELMVVDHAERPSAN